MSTFIRLCLPAVTALLLSAPPAHAATAADAPVLLHAFSFESGVSSSVGAMRSGTLFGDATVTNGVLNLSGSNAYLEFTSPLVPMAQDNGNSAWSISAWVRQTAALPNLSATFIGVGGDTSLIPQLSFAISASGTPVLSQGTAYGVNASGAGMLAQQTWHHVAMVGTSLNVNLYADGVLVGSGGSSLKYTASSNNVGTTRFGRQVLTYGQQFTGQIDDVKIYSGRLSAGEISAQFAAGPSVSAVPEPAGAPLLLAGLAGLGWVAARRRARHS